MAFNNTSTIARAKFETAREMNYADIDSVMTMIGTPFAVSFSVLYVQNFTDVIIDFSVSFDGANVTFSLAPNGIIASDMTTNQIQISAGEAAWCQYRSGAPSSGFVQVSAITAV